MPAGSIDAWGVGVGRFGADVGAAGRSSSPPPPLAVISAIARDGDHDESRDESHGVTVRRRERRPGGVAEAALARRDFLPPEAETADSRRSASRDATFCGHAGETDSRRTHATCASTPASRSRRRRLLERPLEQRRQHDLRLRAGHPGVVADPLERLLEVRGVTRADAQDRARLARHGVRGLDLGVALDRLADLGGGHPPLAGELDERVRAPAEAARVDGRRVAAHDAVRLQPVDPPLDRRRRQRDPQPDALERAPRVLPEERNDLPVDVVH